MTKKTYSWKITAKKALLIGFEVILAGTVVYLTDNNLFLVIVPLIEVARNFLKHKDK